MLLTELVLATQFALPGRLVLLLDRQWELDEHFIQPEMEATFILP